jgi:hypothetical protein
MYDAPDGRRHVAGEDCTYSMVILFDNEQCIPLKIKVKWGFLQISMIFCVCKKETINGILRTLFFSKNVSHKCTFVGHISF